MKIMTVAGSRAQVAALSHLSRCLRREHEEVLVFCPPTDDLPADDQLWQGPDATRPRYQWAVRPETAGRRAADLLVRLERVMRRERPDIVLVHGGTDAAMAAALVAAQLHFESAHVEAGLRTPQVCLADEINRRIADRLASFCFCATEAAAARLEREGVRGGLYTVGDPAFDALAADGEAPVRHEVLAGLGLEADGYYLAAVSLPERDQGAARLQALLAALSRLDPPAALVVHPRLRLVLHQANMPLPEDVRALDPLAHADMLAVEAGARAIVTDSVAVQREAVFLGVPCVVVGEPAWPEPAQAGLLAGVEPEARAIAAALRSAAPKAEAAHAFGDGHASERIVDILAGGTSPAPEET